MSNERRFRHFEEVVLGGELAFECLGDGGDDAVGGENAAERPDQGAADQMAQHLRRFGDRPHGVDDAQDGGNDPEGGQRIGGVADRAGDQAMVVFMGFDLEVHDRLELMGIVRSQGQQTEIITNEFDKMVVAGNEAVILKNRTFLRLLDMRLDGNITL